MFEIKFHNFLYEKSYHYLFQAQEPLTSHGTNDFV